ncbi:MAG TPA: hypothetical protein VKC66_01620 [Xanthobacteraceae bacterium]|nr:hypothetical protein [Xanthobacteraceae bacterium]
MLRATLLLFLKLLACLCTSTLAGGGFALLATSKFALTRCQRRPFRNAKPHHCSGVAHRLDVDHMDAEIKIINRVEPFGHATEDEALQPQQVRLGDCHRRNHPALPFGFDRVGAAEHGVISDVILRPLVQVREVARLHHLVYILLDLTHELAHLSIGELLRLILLVVVLLVLVLGLLLRDSKSAQHESGCSRSRN